jgi:hypothetical protein
MSSFTHRHSEDEVRADYVKLSWEAPEDDGGTPIIKYIVRLLDLDYNEWINVCEVLRAHVLAVGAA